MNRHRPSLFLSMAALFASALVAATAQAGATEPSSSSTDAAVAAGAGADSGAALQLAQYEGTQPPELKPRYEPVEPRPRSNFNDEYIFGLTRGVAESTMHPAAKVLIFPLTVPLDFALLPFEVIGGFFG